MPQASKKPFHLTIVGATGTGKTHFLLNLLEKEYKGYFNRIYLICPTFHENKTYKEWAYTMDDEVIVPPCSLNDIEYVLEHIVEDSTRMGDHDDGNKNLLILDDCASSGALVTSAFGSRHDGLSVVVITQQFTSIAKPWRDNQSRLVFFYNSNKKDVDQMFNDYLGFVTKEEKNNILRKINQPYAYLDINLIPPPVTYEVVVQ